MGKPTAHVAVYEGLTDAEVGHLLVEFRTGRFTGTSFEVVTVAAICGATAGLARAGLLDDRDHTSASAEYLEMTGYAGGDRYVDERAVVDSDLVTAGPQSPVSVRARGAGAPGGGLREHPRGLRGALSSR